MRGRITTAQDGYYFISSFENGAEYFVAPADIKNGATLAVDQLVSFTVGFDGIRGEYATNVTPVEAA